MRIGLVRFLNARPLDFAFQTLPERYPDVECHPDTPSRLVGRLLAGELDAALISSVECYRNRSTLSWCDTVGVASEHEVQSLLYLRRQCDPLDAPVRRIYMDEGSRTTVALTRLLYLQEFGELPECVSTSPDRIPSLVDAESAGLVIGDAALALFECPGEFHFRDMVEWWRKKTGLPFVAALWAYPTHRIADFPDSFFTTALDLGMERIDAILSQYGERYRAYLTDALHYHLTSRDREALALFSSLLQGRGLL